MKVRLHDAFVTPGYFETVSFPLDLSSQELLTDVGIKAHPCVVTAEIRNEADIVTVRFFGEVQYDAACDRCLTPIRKTLAFDFTKDAQKDDISGEYEGIDVAPDETFDAEAETLHEILISFPVKHLCKDDCKGLCPVCGCDRNVTECSCEQKVLDPRLEILRNLSL